MGSAKLHALFLSGEEKLRDGSRIYRCDYQAKQLRLGGWGSRVLYWKDATPSDLASAHVVIFSRCKWSPEIAAQLATARSAGALVCGDLDDRIYCPWAAEETGAQRSEALVKPNTRASRLGVASQRATLRLLPLLDRVIVSTPKIVEELEGLGIECVLSRNAIDTDKWPPIEHERSALRRILFMTGTRTHDADFRPLVSVLRGFLLAHPHVHLTLLGPLTPPHDLCTLPNVVRHSKLPMAELYPFVGSHDLCLFPLEATAFNDCKSALKFIECGLVSVPLIASPRREFQATIVSGANGFIADAPAQWLDTLETLARSPALLTQAARGAHETVMREHTLHSRGMHLANQLSALVRARRGS